MAKKNLTTVTLSITASAESLKALKAFMDTMSIEYSDDLRVEAPKAETTPIAIPSVKGAKGKAAKGQTVLRVDRYGNKWVAEYDGATYAAKKAEMLANGTYSSKNRSAVYKALGWIL